MLRIRDVVLGLVGGVVRAWLLLLLLLDLWSRHAVRCQEGDEFLLCEGES